MESVAPLIVPRPYSEMQMNCPECPTIQGPDQVLTHLVAQHFYTLPAAQKAVRLWMDRVDKDHLRQEDLWPK